MFETLEDETGVTNVIVWPKVFERYRTVVIGSRFIGVRGPLRSQDGVIHVVARQTTDLTPLLSGLSDIDGPIDGLARADEVRRQPIPPEERQKAAHIHQMVLEAPQRRSTPNIHAMATRGVLPKGRNFH